MRSRAVIGCGVVLVVIAGCGNSTPSKTGQDEDPVASGCSENCSESLPSTAGQAESFASEAGRARESLALANGQTGKKVFWGDLHVHTSYSLDAYAFGTRQDQAAAYAFARKRGKAYRPNGQSEWIDRPLDFAAITDHSEFLDVMELCIEEGDGKTHPFCRLIALYSKLRDGGNPPEGTKDFFEALESDTARPDVCQSHDCKKARESLWSRIQKTANDYNDPGRFTTFIGYEWTNTPAGKNLHRNIIFKNKNVPNEVIDSVSYDTPSKLWNALDQNCKLGAGCDVLSIPHNSNLSNGLMFALETNQRDRLLRARFDRIVEMFQHKGNSECLSADPRDQSDDCNFEIMLQNGLIGLPPATRAGYDKIRQGYVRTALLLGISSYRKSATKLNPLEFGLIGATDTHDANPGAVSETAYKGAHGGTDDDIEERLKSTFVGGINPGGLTAVWAKKNTREEIFAALKRREVYATSGPRITLRFYAASEKQSPLGCLAGEPKELAAMGGVIKGALPTKYPTFYINAAKDKAGLASLELIRGTVDAAGKTHEKVIPVKKALSLGGAGTLCVVYEDKTFDAKQPTFWYARVKEVKTPRWSKLQCQQRPELCKNKPAFKVDIQERAWSSPIWYYPR
jgi:hypothetical protein